MNRLALLLTVVLAPCAHAGFTAKTETAGTFTAAEAFAPRNVVAPTVSGGQTLTASPGSWKPAGTTFEYRWERESTGVVGSGTSYGASSADAGQRVRVVVTARNGDRVSAPVASQWVIVGPPEPPVSIAPPAISGGIALGTTLTASPGTWEHEPASFTGEWQHCQPSGTGCTVVSTGAAYTLSTADIGFALRRRVTAANATGTASAISPLSAPLAPSARTPGSVAGPKLVGSALQLTSPVWDTNPSLSSTARREWWRCSGATCTRITGASSRTYVLSAADADHVVQAREFVTQNGVEGMSSASAGPIKPLPPLLGATVTSSLSHDPAGLPRVVDGFWQTSWGPSSLVAAGAWVRLDFGAVRSLVAYDGYASAGDYEVSVDGTTWTAIPLDSPAWGNGGPSTIFDSPIEARYLRLRTRFPSATGWSVNEIRVWGT